MRSQTLLAQIVAEGTWAARNPAVIGPGYDRQAERVIELQTEKARVRLADLSNGTLN